MQHPNQFSFPTKSLDSYEEWPSCFSLLVPHGDSLWQKDIIPPMDSSTTFFGRLFRPLSFHNISLDATSIVIGHLYLDKWQSGHPSENYGHIFVHFSFQIDTQSFKVKNFKTFSIALASILQCSLSFQTTSIVGRPHLTLPYI